MISQLFCLSSRGDAILTRDFRREMTKGTNEIFFRKVKFWKGDAPPIFNVEGINFIHIKRNGMYFVATTMYNIPPAYVIECLDKLTKIIKDFLGVLSEETLRKNFTLMYEIIDEVLDYGHPQLSSTDQIRPYIVNEPIILPFQKLVQSSFKPSFFGSSTKPSTSSCAPIATVKKDEIYVDIFEKLTMLFNSNGYIVNSCIDGCIQMKSYLKGNPELKLFLNDDIVVGRQNAKSSINSVVLDDCNFHECVNAKDFETLKQLKILPPDGEFVIMNYRINSEFQPPFRIYPFIDELSNYKLQMIVKIKTCFAEDHFAGQILVKFAVPRETASVSLEKQKTPVGQEANYNSSSKMVEWTIKKMQGGSDVSLITKISLDAPNAISCRKELGPISMQFEIPMLNVSNLNVKTLTLTEKDKPTPHRWVRYVTQASSYTCRT